ncbi:MAG: nicotinamide riboside transporter PnuC [Bacteroidota bacterium]
MPTYEIIGFIATILCVWMNMKEIIWGFPVAIIASAFYFIVFYQNKLYSDAGLQIIYIILNFYGWYQWYSGDNKKQLHVSRTPSSLIPILTGLGLLTAGFLGYGSHQYTDASLPYLDAATTATSLVAQWMLAKKHLENWLIWIVVDIIYVGMYFYKELYPTAALYFFLTLLAVQGYVQWKKAMAAAV